MEPKLLLVEELAQNLKELKSDDENVLFTGDGMHVHGAWLKENVSKSKMAPAVCSTPRAAAVAELGAKKWREGKAINADDHRPIYLKKSQAEQEREAGIYTKGSLRPGESGTPGKDLLTKNGSDAVKLSVRRMCKADLLAVAQLEKECFAEAWSENALAESLAEANYVFFVCSGIEAVLHGR